MHIVMQYSQQNDTSCTDNDVTDLLQGLMTGLVEGCGCLGVIEISAATDRASNPTHRPGSAPAPATG